MKKMLNRRKAGFDPCVDFAVLEFQDKYHDQVAQLLHTFPLDHVTSEGTLFWSGPKRPPAAIKFDPEDPLHLDFVVAASRDREAIKKMANDVRPPEFRPKEMSIKVDDR